VNEDDTTLRPDLEPLPMTGMVIYIRIQPITTVGAAAKMGVVISADLEMTMVAESMVAIKVAEQLEAMAATVAERELGVVAERVQFHRLKMGAKQRMLRSSRTLKVRCACCVVRTSTTAAA
jgi:hypothetical protein